MNTKLILKGILVLSVTFSLLSFTVNRFGAGSVFCFANADVPNINQNLACDASGQPPSIKIDYALVSSGGSTTNPCPNMANQTPFDGAIAGRCLPVTLGSTRFAATAE